jgi:microcompartment protein CcmK/EutM
VKAKLHGDSCGMRAWCYSGAVLGRIVVPVAVDPGFRRVSGLPAEGLKPRARRLARASGESSRRLRMPQKRRMSVAWAWGGRWSRRKEPSVSPSCTRRMKVERVVLATVQPREEERLTVTDQVGAGLSAWMVFSTKGAKRPLMQGSPQVSVVGWTLRAVARAEMDSLAVMG